MHTLNIKKRIAFLFFAAAILFSVVREWNAPVACLRPALDRAVMAESLTD
jgi:hypothetical protein